MSNVLTCCCFSVITIPGALYPSYKRQKGTKLTYIGMPTIGDSIKSPKLGFGETLTLINLTYMGMIAVSKGFAPSMLVPTCYTSLTHHYIFTNGRVGRS